MRAFEHYPAEGSYISANLQLFVSGPYNNFELKTLSWVPMSQHSFEHKMKMRWLIWHVNYCLYVEHIPEA